MLDRAPDYQASCLIESHTNIRNQGDELVPSTFFLGLISTYSHDFSSP
jgi:hypothetical protein